MERSMYRTIIVHECTGKTTLEELGEVYGRENA